MKLPIKDAIIDYFRRYCGRTNTIDGIAYGIGAQYPYMHVYTAILDLEEDGILESVAVDGHREYRIK